MMVRKESLNVDKYMVHNVNEQKYIIWNMMVCTTILMEIRNINNVNSLVAFWCSFGHESGKFRSFHYYPMTNLSKPTVRCFLATEFIFETGKLNK